MKLLCQLLLVFTSALSFAQTRLDTEEVITIGGIKQYITIQSQDESLPILLFLHGGPGGSVMDYAHKFTNRLREHFIVVQWDQRQTGRTLELNTSPVPLTLNLFQTDAYELIEVLLKRFNRNKLYLAGHSWGTALGFHIVRTHPELLHAYICIGPMINQLESERIALTLMKSNAEKKGNHKAKEELEGVHIPFENGLQLYYHRRWLLDYAGSRKRLTQGYVEEWARTWLNVFNEASKDNLPETLSVIACPIYFFAGTKDYQTNSSLAEKYYQVLSAPQKGFFWFDTGHSIPSAAPGRMQDIIIGTVLPETIGRSAF